MRMPERIWADRSDDGLPAYADTPFGIWWCASREGYSEFVRADLFAATLARAERAEAALAEAVEAIEYFMDGWGLVAPEYSLDPEDDELFEHEWAFDKFRAILAKLEAKP